MDESLPPGPPHAGRRNGHPPTAASRRALLERIVALVRTTPPEALAGPLVAAHHRRLHDDALELFGRWDVALAAALRELAQTDPAAAGIALAPSPMRAPDAATPARADTRAATLRQPHPAALRPTLALSEHGFVLELAGAAVQAAEAPAAPAPIAGWRAPLGAPRELVDAGPVESLLAVSCDGRLFELAAADIPALADVPDGELPQRLGEDQGVARWLTLLERNPVDRPRLFVHATRRGRVKVSPMSAVQRALEQGAQGLLAFALDPDDVPIGAWQAERSDALLLAGSSGQVTVVELDALSPEPLESRGVRALRLRGAGELVGGVVGGRGLEVALITRRGLARRVPVDAFRGASRGAPCARLAEGDTLAAIVVCHPSTDLVVLTDRARALRLPAPAVPLRECAARGEAIVELEPGEQVCGLSRLLPLAYASAQPNPFEI